MTSSSPPPPPTGVLCRVDGESLNSLIEKYDQSLVTNTSEQERVGKLKQEYLTVKSKLTTLPHQLEYNALVPLGRRALCPGKIIHTNEIMCLLGDNWFVECSATKAIEIANHRIAKLDEQFESLRKERELINNWKQEAERQLVETIGDGTVEIREDYNEDYERHWQEQHRESVRRHHQQLAKQRREAKQEKSQSVGDAELWVRLEELEIQEELQDYVERENISEEKSANISKTLTQATSHSNPRNAVVKDTEVSNSSAAAPVSENSASDNKTEVAPSAPAPKGKKVKFSADTIVHDISNDINYENQESYNQEKSTSSTVGFTDESTTQTYPCFDPIMIRFRHSSPADIGDDEDANASGTEEEDHTSQIVASPGEIVKVFGPTSISAISTKPLPKSILKPFAPPLTVAVTEPRSKKGKGKVSNKMKPVLSFADEDDSIDNGDDIDIDSICPVSKIVTERVPVFTALQLNDSSARQNSETDESNESKPVSLFKMRRQQQSVAMAATSPE